MTGVEETAAVGYVLWAPAEVTATGAVVVGGEVLAGATAVTASGAILVMGAGGAIGFIAGGAFYYLKEALTNSSVKKKPVPCAAGAGGGKKPPPTRQLVCRNGVCFWCLVNADGSIVKRLDDTPRNPDGSPQIDRDRFIKQ